MYIYSPSLLHLKMLCFNTERVILGLGALCFSSVPLYLLELVYPHSFMVSVSVNPMTLAKCSFHCTAPHSFRTVHIRIVLKDFVR